MCSQQLQECKAWRGPPPLYPLHTSAVTQVGGRASVGDDLCERTEMVNVWLTTLNFRSRRLMTKICSEGRTRSQKISKVTWLETHRVSSADGKLCGLIVYWTGFSLLPHLWQIVWPLMQIISQIAWVRICLICLASSAHFPDTMQVHR